MKTNLIQTCLLAALLALPAVSQGQFIFTTNNGAITITGYTGPGGAVIIPAQINGLPVTSIGDYAFDECSSLVSVTIPNSVTNIGESAFWNCYGLTSVTIPDSVTSIGDLAFADCTSLTKVTIGDGVTSIARSVFANCTSLNCVTIPNSVTNIGAAAFDYCTSLTDIKIPDSVVSIEDGFRVPEDVQPRGVFGRCALTSITIPNSVTYIGKYAFVSCTSLTNVTIGYGVTTIGYGAFESSGLTSVTIPGSVTNIGESAFWNCYGLTSAYFKGNAPAADETVFLINEYGGSYYNATAYYLPDTTGWDEFTADTRVTAVPWLPLIQTDDGSFGVRTNQFGFNINWASGQTVVVEACTNLANPVWLPVSTNSFVGGTSYFSDPQPANLPGRFYRLRSQ